MAPPEESKTIFKFTRHVLSCNNIGAGKGQELFLIKKISGDYEPGLSHSGILETLKYVKEHYKDFESCDVCVSNLYRTWCTAVILYGNGLKKPSSQGMIHYLNLWICPHLKEEHKTEISMRQNGPKPIDHMVKKFKKFLDTLLEIIKNKEEYKNFSFPDKIYLNLYTSELSIMYEKDNNEYKLDKNYKTPSSKDNEYYKEDKVNKWLETGNLSTFMNWFNEENNKIKKNNTKTEKVHVVTHSNVMQNYLKELSLNKLKKKYRDKKNFCFTKNEDNKYKLDKIDYLAKTNCWSFETKKSFLEKIKKWIERNNDSIEPILKNLFIEDMIVQLNDGVSINAENDPKQNLIHILKSIKMGVIKQGNAKDIEKDNKEFSLCGYQGKVDKRSLFDKTKSLVSGTRRGGKLKGKKITRKGSKLKRNKITRKRRNTRTRKKGLVKRGGCYRDKTQEKMEKHINDPNTQIKINEIYPPWDEEKELGFAINSVIAPKYDTNPPNITTEIKKYDITKIINTIISKEKGVDHILGQDVSDDIKNTLHHMSQSREWYNSKKAIKDEIIHFVRTYPDKTFMEYIPFSHDKDNLFTFVNINQIVNLSDNEKEKLEQDASQQPNNRDIFILDTNGQPFPKDQRYTLKEEPRAKLWNILHEQNPNLLTTTILDNNSDTDPTRLFNKKILQLINSHYNNQLKQNIEEYINIYPNNIYEDWIKQDNIFKKYVMPDKRHIFSIMYLENHPALHYWNEYSKNKVTYRTKVNKDPTKPNDPDTYVYEIENKKP